MWSLIPTSVLYWIINLIILAGAVGLIAGWLGRWIPWFGMYARLLKPLGVVLLVVGVWMRGGYDTEMAWRAKVETLEAKVRESEAKSKAANAELSRSITERNRVIAENRQITQQRLRQNSQQIDKECKVDPVAIEILNESAKNTGKARK